MTGDDLFDYAASIKSRRDFVQFLQFLKADYRARNNEWQNKDLESYLDGLFGFANDMDSYYKNMGETVDVEAITWRMAAQMLLAASVYE